MILILSVLLVFVVGCQPEQESTAIAQEAPPVKVVQVSVETVKSKKMVETFTLPGSLEAWEDLTLAAELNGAIRWIGPEEGDPLKSGQDILKIDTDTLQADYERHRISFEIKQRKFDRYEKLVSQQLVSQQELDDMKYSLEEVRADLRHSELMLLKGVLRSPVVGVLDDLMVDRGEYVVTGQPMARIVQVDRLKVMVDVPEKDVSYLKVGDDIRIVGAVIDGKEAVTTVGRIQHIAYTADPATRTYRAKIAIDNKDGVLRPGNIVRAHFSRRNIQNALSVPLYALIDRDGRKVVFVEDNGVARMVSVTTGAVIGRRIVVEEGLAAGDRIIVKGQQLIMDGAQVAVEGE